jgi:hypothetical protein
VSDRTRYGNSQFYRAEWRDGRAVDRWIRDMAQGTLLNWPCGQSPIGDIRADIDPAVGPDVYADLRDPPFDPRSVGTGYIDPPYSMCAFDEILQWLPKVWDCIDRRLILNSTPIMVSLDGAELEVYHEHRPGTPHLPTFHVWTRQDTRLDDYGGASA